MVDLNSCYVQGVPAAQAIRATTQTPLPYRTVVERKASQLEQMSLRHDRGEKSDDVFIGGVTMRRPDTRSVPSVVVETSGVIGGHTATTRSFHPHMRRDISPKIIRESRGGHVPDRHVERRVHMRDPNHRMLTGETELLERPTRNEE